MTMAVIRPSADSALTFARRIVRSRMHIRQVLEDLDEIAAGSALDAHRNGEQLQVFRADALDHVEHRIVEVGAVGKLVAQHAELGPDRVGQFARDQRNRRRQGMSRHQAPIDHIQRRRATGQ